MIRRLIIALCIGLALAMLGERGDQSVSEELLAAEIADGGCDHSRDATGQPTLNRGKPLSDVDRGDPISLVSSGCPRPSSRTCTSYRHMARQCRARRCSACWSCTRRRQKAKETSRLSGQPTNAASDRRARCAWTAQRACRFDVPQQAAPHPNPLPIAGARWGEGIAWRTG